MDFTNEELAEFYAYLDELRESGETNMYGARPYLTEKFDLGRRDAAVVLTGWMKTFDPDKTPEQRAENGLPA